ncbi:MAG TPA: protease complex subunit PrcB family protein, partial [Tissierellaceae bacterium]|nr:protease complex subunit PrcB family protein [Tissierellaceae bacterium]
TKQFPTPGYTMDIKNIIKTEEGYKIILDIKSPDSDTMIIQVITYQTISIEIPKDELGDTPYNFILDGYNKIADRVNV